ncbi:iron uptake transporter deferrochelatase/peroxidase subunit [Corynebacterium anserum]|uniref:Deferrochelatase n=1 Tax=Corynebacterium anserum TaxID=2684406 RepID=A0A7G7YP15_9CORY|nr:iron uptake transporter deferrochelatase/peroxidase subunit [Corynebacterium anserum]MBC2681836.1 deferrochelatase/peroxidase EfeB [Corynebacterium anserum]QNH96235.1 deferrochelatase/peroxidase EfeB [Corynebacterium anserum]
MSNSSDTHPADRKEPIPTEQKHPFADAESPSSSAESHTSNSGTGEKSRRGSVSRRKFLAGLGLSAGAGALIGGGGVTAVRAASQSHSSTPQPVPFYGTHQAGITTAQQENLHIVALDVLTKDKAELKDMLTRWTAMSERMSRGLPAAEQPSDSEYAVPADSGEADDLSTNNLTITIGYGPSLFDGRFGLKDRKPRRLKALPTFPSDQLIKEFCDGDIVVQACADDPQVAVHAIRNLVRAGSGVVEVRWSQLGYGRASSTSEEQTTPRNLFGFKDGTRNIHSGEKDDLNTYVWSDEEGWMNGGSYLCARRIRMLLELWDRQILGEQQATFARYRHSGAPLGLEDDAAREFDAVPFDLVLGTEPAIPTDSHVYLSHPDNNDGQRMLRRAYNFIEGSDSFGHLSAGLFFIAFVGDPQKSFIPIQMKLSRNDRMNEYVRYESKAIFACPAGLPEDGSLDWGTQLFD